VSRPDPDKCHSWSLKVACTKSRKQLRDVSNIDLTREFLI